MKPKSLEDLLQRIMQASGELTSGIVENVREHVEKRFHYDNPSRDFKLI